MFDRNLLTVYAHDVNDIFKNVEHNRAFQEWLKSISDKKTPMNHDFIVNIRAAQERPMTGPVGSGRAYTYREYFGKAAWVKDMPPIDQVQIIPDDLACFNIEKTKYFPDADSKILDHNLTPTSPDENRLPRDHDDNVRNSSDDPSKHRTDWEKLAAPSQAKPLPKTDWEKLAAPPEAKVLPKKDWSQVAPGSAKDIPKKDWTKAADAPREFKTLPTRKPSFDRDR